MQTIINSIPDGVCSLTDYRQHAQQLLSSDIWAYIAGGCADGLTQHRNRQAFDKLLLQQRVLRAGLETGHCRTVLAGQSLELPVLVAPVAYQKLVHATGELGSLQAAQAQGAGFVLSTLSSYTLEQVVGSAECYKPWFQLYCQPNKETTLALVRRAEDAGYHGLMVTVDAPINGVRNAEQRANFKLPPHVSAANLVNGVPRACSDHSVFSGWMPHAPTWKTLEWLRSQTALPLFVKGIMSPLDAVQAITLGAEGLVVSNHGGRVLDSQPSSIEVLPAIRAAVGEVPLVIDSGIRRGSDIFKAIALGADAVMVGRPVLYALTVAGPMGVAHILRILRDELEATMVLCGCATLADITPRCLYQNPSF